MIETIFKIEGMKCMHCKMIIENTLKNVPGVTSARVDLVNNKVMVVGSADQIIMAKAVDEAGYQIIG